jgi:hypothetical protein
MRNYYQRNKVVHYKLTTNIHIPFSSKLIIDGNFHLILLEIKNFSNNKS